MTAEPREELISAYLDGELSEEQRAEVERWLAESPELRRLYAELRAMREGLQSLPRHKLDDDMSGAVLRRAEQAILRGGDSEPVSRAVQTLTQTVWWNRAGWRRVVWPALAVAAALAILVYDANRRPAEREVARTLDHDEYAAASGEKAPAAKNLAESVASPEADRDESPVPSSELETFDSDSDGLGLKPPAQMIERRSATRSDEGSVLEDRAKPRAAQSASEPARGAVNLKARDMPAVPSLAADGIVIGCTPQFLRDRKFEKLLDEKKIKWRRVAENESPTKKAKSLESLDRIESLEYKIAADQRLRMTYQVTATQDQVEGILTQLEQRAGALNRAYYESNRSQSRAAVAPADGKPSDFTITLVAPTSAVKPVVPAEPPATPAEEQR